MAALHFSLKDAEFMFSKRSLDSSNHRTDFFSNFHDMTVCDATKSLNILSIQEF